MARKTAVLFKDLVGPSSSLTTPKVREVKGGPSNNTSMRVHPSEQNSQLGAGSLPRLDQSRAVFGEGGSQNSSSHAHFTPLKRDLQYNLRQSIDYFSKCGDSV